MIVITGATGYVGGMLAAELARRGQPMRLLVRDPARAPRVSGAEVRVAEYGDAAALAAALDPGDRVFMVSLHEGPATRVPLHRAFIAAAAARRVGQIAYLSFLHAGPGAKFSHARSHGATEELLRTSGVPWTAVRNGMYADDIPGWFDVDGVAREPGDGGRLSFSDRAELAEALAVVLTTPGHEARIYNVVAPDAVSLADLARIASEVSGRPYRYQPTSDDEWIGRWRADGANDWQIEAGRTSYEALRAGELEVESEDYRKLTGKTPLGVRELVARMAASLPLH
jgi:uncharacterized protein YbjT (DUF2867 family)